MKFVKMAWEDQMRRSEKKPLYRKVNSRVRWSKHGRRGGDFRHERNGKQSEEQLRHQVKRGTMHRKHRHGLDYTPLFRFLLSKVGHDWERVHSEARSRLDRPDPIYWMVAQYEDQQRDVVWLGECSRYSGLYVDDEGLLQRVAPALGPEQLHPTCACCTHTFNGVVLTNPPKLPRRPWLQPPEDPAE